MADPVFGLMVAYRPYRCDCCNHVHDVQTNHSDVCYAYCPNCSWKSAKDSKGNYYRADIGKNRPHYYAGPAITEAEFNPHWPASHFKS